MQEGIRFEFFHTYLEAEFRRYAENGGDAIRPGAVDEFSRIIIAMRRAKGTAEIMRMDLNFDNVVVEDEVRTVLKAEQEAVGNSPALDQRREQRVKDYLAVDTNGDGRIDWTEAAAQATKVDAEDRAEKGGRGAFLLTLDPNGDGVLTLTEYQAVGDAFFRGVDTDGDGLLSRAEVTAYRSGAPAAEAAPQRATETTASERQISLAGPLAAVASQMQSAACGMPAPSAETDVAVVSLYEAEALSSATIATQDQVTEAVMLTIEPGDKPLYVVALSGAAMIWRVTGAVERVERLVVSSNTGLVANGTPTIVPLMGETGIPKDRALFLASTGCLKAFREAPSIASAQTVAVIRARLGKDPVVVAAGLTAGAFLLPSGTVQSVSEKGAFPTVEIEGSKVRIQKDPESMTLTTGADDPASDLGRSNPGGVVEIDAESVVSELPVVPYEVLPREAGLLQLLKSGALTRDTKGEYLIREKIRLPAELCADHAVTFLLMRGVPEPDGNPCHSKVYSEESGLLLKGVD